MKLIRRSEERGYVDFGWLKSYHSFSFGDYYDPQFMGYKSLRVINHDFIASNSEFPMHGHRDMEIITYVLKGLVEHQDSLGNKAQTVAGDVQVMHAGTGIRHSERNPSSTSELELLQIWVQPVKEGLKPGYVQKSFSEDVKKEGLHLIASPAGEEGSLVIHAQAKLYASLLKAGGKVNWQPPANHGTWIQIAQGELEVQGEKLKKGDAILIENESHISIIGGSDLSEILLFDLW
jgi:redox-sensitive bicupin YhaK (pirin superfamily)